MHCSADSQALPSKLLHQQHPRALSLHQPMNNEHPSLTQALKAHLQELIGGLGLEKHLRNEQPSKIKSASPDALSRRIFTAK